VIAASRPLAPATASPRAAAAAAVPVSMAVDPLSTLRDADTNDAVAAVVRSSAVCIVSLPSPLADWDLRTAAVSVPPCDSANAPEDWVGMPVLLVAPPSPQSSSGVAVAVGRIQGAGNKH
jgi:hypothetical protein